MCSCHQQRKYQSYASQAICDGNPSVIVGFHRREPVMRKAFHVRTSSYMWVRSRIQFQGLRWKRGRAVGTRCMTKGNIPTVHKMQWSFYGWQGGASECDISLVHLLPNVAYMRQWTGTALVQIMAWRLFGAKPLSEPMLDYCQLDPQEQISVTFE